MPARVQGCVGWSTTLYYKQARFVVGMFTAIQELVIVWGIVRGRRVLVFLAACLFFDLESSRGSRQIG